MNCSELAVFACSLISIGGNSDTCSTSSSGDSLDSSCFWRRWMRSFACSSCDFSSAHCFWKAMIISSFCSNVCLTPLSRMLWSESACKWVRIRRQRSAVDAFPSATLPPASSTAIERETNRYRVVRLHALGEIRGQLRRARLFRLQLTLQQLRVLERVVGAVHERVQQRLVLFHDVVNAAQQVHGTRRKRVGKHEVVRLGRRGSSWTRKLVCKKVKLLQDLIEVWMSWKSGQIRGDWQKSTQNRMLSPEMTDWSSEYMSIFMRKYIQYGICNKGLELLFDINFFWNELLWIVFCRFSFPLLAFLLNHGKFENSYRWRW